MKHLEQEIAEWKEIYKDIYLYRLEDKELKKSYDFIFRNIGRAEYYDLVSANAGMGKLQEMICELCVLYPKYDFANGAAGFPEIISNFIVENSGFNEGQAEMLLHEFRHEMEYFDHQVAPLIHEAFPEFTLEEISYWTMRKTMFYLSRAEWILSNLRGVPIEQTPSEEVEQEDSQEFQHTFKNQNYQEPIQEEDNQFEETKEDLPTNTNKEINKETELMQMLGAQQNIDLNQKESMSTKDYPELNWFRSEEDTPLG